MSQVKIIVKDEWGKDAKVEVVEKSYKSIQKFVKGDFEELILEKMYLNEDENFETNEYYPLLPKNCTAYCNAEGRLLNLEEIIYQSLGNSVYGPVVMCNYNDDGEMIDFTEEEQEIVCKFLDSRECVRMGGKNCLFSKAIELGIINPNYPFD